MKVMEPSDMNRSIKEAMLRVMVTLVALLAFTPFFFAKGPALAEEEGPEDSHAEGYESRIYGIVEKAPPAKIGVWSVNKREVKVSNMTRIIEKHGKAEAGAYVEVEGNNTGKTFSASRIEVKRAKMK